MPSCTLITKRADIAALIQDIFTVTLAELFRGHPDCGRHRGVGLLLRGTHLVDAWDAASMIVAAAVFGRLIRKLSKQTQDEVAASNIVVQDVLTAIVSVKSYANEWLERRKYGGMLLESSGYTIQGPGGVPLASFIIMFIF